MKILLAPQTAKASRHLDFIGGQFSFSSYISIRRMLPKMNELTTYNKQIQGLCNLYNVKTLFAFGSVITDKYRADSDIDLIVDIDSSDPIDYSDKYFNLKFNLEDLLHRHIDLLEDKAIRNPYLRQQIDNTKVLVYGK